MNVTEPDLLSWSATMGLGRGRGFGYGRGRGIGSGRGKGAFSGYTCVKFTFFIFNVVFWVSRLRGITARYWIWCSVSLSLLPLHFNGHFPGGPGLARSRIRMSPFWIVLKLRMTEVVVTAGAIRRAKLQSNRYHQQTNTKLFTGRMPFLSPDYDYDDYCFFSILFCLLHHHHHLCLFRINVSADTMRNIW